MLTAREAIQQAIERAQLGDIEGGHLWLGIATELRIGSAGHRDALGTLIVPEPVPPEVVQFDPGAIAVPAPEPAYRRAETEVIQRMPDESTPAYDAAGDSLGETKSIPTRIAHPRPDDRGPTSECLSCELPVLWIRGRGWCHEVPSHTASCDKAELEARHG